MSDIDLTTNRVRKCRAWKCVILSAQNKKLISYDDFACETMGGQKIQYFPNRVILSLLLDDIAKISVELSKKDGGEPVVITAIVEKITEIRKRNIEKPSKSCIGGTIVAAEKAGLLTGKELTDKERANFVSEHRKLTFLWANSAPDQIPPSLL